MLARKNIVLIRPDLGTLLYAYKQVNPPIGLGYLAAYLEREGYHVYVLDLGLIQLDFRTLVQFIQAKEPVLVGISALTSYYSGMKTLSTRLKEMLPGTVIVLGGVHPSSLPEYSLEECHADFVVIGEGETTLLELVKAVERGEKDYSMIDGIAYMANGKVHFTKPREPIADLDALPMPAWEKINPNKYPKNPHGVVVKYSQVAPILSTRGCPFSCQYCASCRFWRQRIRFRSPEKVVDEIQYLHEKFGIREIHFWDDNLTLKRDHIIGICKEIIKRRLNNIAFSTPNGVKVDTLDETIMRWMRAAGFYCMTFAVESGSPKILHEMEKKVDLKKIVRNTFIAKKLGFRLNSFFMIGFPGDTRDTIIKTIRYANSIPLDFRTFFILKPLPGSKLFSEWASSRNLKDFDWDDMKCYMEVNRLEFNKLPPDVIAKLQRKALNVNFINIPRLINLILLTIQYFHFSQLKIQIERFLHVIAGYSVSVFTGQR